MKKDKRFSREVEKILFQAGWFPARTVNDDTVNNWEIELEKSDSFLLFPKAREALLEFGNIKVVQSGGGIDFARETFEIDPLLLWGESERMLEIKTETGFNAYPLGEAGHGHLFLAIIEDGRVFIINSHIELIGHNIDDALENLILGRNPDEAT